ncbi:MAG: hypothetical protein NTW86_24420, partial [Candidatus Sumerlaeota bacterium]|nr:hypothetical protein [Candidatus Sumerlaeota bacterium]
MLGACGAIGASQAPGATKSILCFSQYVNWQMDQTFLAIDTVSTDYVRTNLSDYQQLPSALPGQDVLLIPEQEFAEDAEMKEVGEAWVWTLRDFVAQGGVIIECYTPGRPLIVEKAGVAALGSAVEITGQAVSVVDPSDPIAQGVADYTGEYVTYSFRCPDGNVVVKSAAGDPVAIDKTIGLGNVIVIGHTYGESNANQSRLIGNAIFNLPAPPDDLVVTPVDDPTFVGPQGGPFNPLQKIYTLRNTGTAPLDWTAAVQEPWLGASPVGGRLGAGASADVAVGLTADAETLAPAIYDNLVTFANLTSGAARTRSARLRVWGVATMPFTEDFENSGTLATYWEATGTSDWRTETTSSYGPHGGKYHLIMDDSVYGDTYSRNELTLTIDLANWENVSLTFWAREWPYERGDGPPPSPFANGADFDGVAVSADGAFWYEVLGLRDLTTTYQHRTVDLDAAIAAHGMSYNSRFRIRFNHYGIGPVDYRVGFGLDDIQITGNPRDDLAIIPRTRFDAAGPVGGPFAPRRQPYTLTNQGTAPLDWAVAKTPDWLTLSSAGGALAPGASVSVDASLTPTVEALPVGAYDDAIVFADQTSGVTETRAARLDARNVAKAPLVEDFEAGEPLAPYWERTGTHAWGTSVTSGYSPHGGAYHLTMGTWPEYQGARNELTLAIDLANWRNVVLTFWIRGSYAEDPDGPPPRPFIGGADFDGVAVSADGATWYEVLGLRDLTETYEQRTVDLDAAVAACGLSYNSSFRIRFNHYGWANDSIGFDDISITGAPPPAGTPNLIDARDEGGGQILLDWDADSSATLAQFLGFAYDLYLGDWVRRGVNGTLWFPFASSDITGMLDVFFSGAYHAWISSQWADGRWLPCLNPQTRIVYSGTPHTPSDAWSYVHSRSAGTWRLVWDEEIYGTWLVQIIV